MRLQAGRSISMSLSDSPLRMYASASMSYLDIAYSEQNRRACTDSIG